MKKIFTLALALAAVLPAAAELKKDVIDASNIQTLATTEFASGNTYDVQQVDLWNGTFFVRNAGYITCTQNPYGLTLKSVEAVAADEYGDPLTVFVSGEPMDGRGSILAATSLGSLDKNNTSVVPEDNWKYVALAISTGTYDSVSYTSFTFTWDQEVGVEGIEAENGKAEYYNLQGVRVENPENGMFIRVQNGKSTKVAIK